MALTLFVLGLPFASGGGIHMFNLFNASAPSWNLLVFTLLEVVAVAWIYGFDNVAGNLAEMGIELNAFERLYWRVCWTYLAPAILTALLVASWCNFGFLEYEGVAYPLRVQVAGWLLTASTLAPVPVMAVAELWKLARAAGSGAGGAGEAGGEPDSGAALLRPTPHWLRQASKYGSCKRRKDADAPVPGLKEDGAGAENEAGK